jgi:hypothetical protein
MIPGWAGAILEAEPDPLPQPAEVSLYGDPTSVFDPSIPAGEMVVLTLGQPVVELSGWKGRMGVRVTRHNVADFVLVDRVEVDANRWGPPAGDPDTDWHGEGPLNTGWSG